MLKNKIYSYLSREIIKNFITILLTFTAIAWTVRSVNFLDLMIEDGYSAIIYFKYTLLNITTILTRFVPLSFLLSLIISIAKFERQQELLILWTTGLNKMKIVNVFFLVAILIMLAQIILGLIINPFFLNKSRSLLRETEMIQANSILKSNDFSDSFEGVTFYIDRKESNGRLINIFIKDTAGTLNTIITEAGKSASTTIFANEGIIKNNKLFLFDGTIQTLGKNKKIKNIYFKKNELSINNLNNRTIKQSKIQETSSRVLFQCLRSKTEKNIRNCSFKKNNKEVTEAVLRRIGMPLYIPLITIMASFLLIHRKEKKYNYIKKYIVFSFAFVVLIFAEIFLKYTGVSLMHSYLYLLTPLVLFLIFYFLLAKNSIYEKVI